MKKILTVAVIAVMLLIPAVSAFAANDSFVSSPSGILAPELIEGTNADKDCEAVVSISSYADRDQLPQEMREMLEAAYLSIAQTSDVGTLTDDVKDLAEELNITTDKLAARDLFDIHYSDCETHDGHSSFTVKLGFENLENYAGLLHYTDEGWELVESELKSNGELTFTVDSLSPFAVLVHDGTAVVEDNSNLGWKIALDVLILGEAVALGYLVYRFVKKPKSGTGN